MAFLVRGTPGKFCHYIEYTSLFFKTKLKGVTPRGWIVSMSCEIDFFTRVLVFCLSFRFFCGPCYKKACWGSPLNLTTYAGLFFFGFFRRFRVHCKYSWPYLYGSGNLQEPAQLSLGLSWRPCGRGPKHSANPRRSAAAAPQSSLGDGIWTAAFSGPSHGAGFGRRTFDRQVRRRRRQP